MSYSINGIPRAAAVIRGNEAHPGLRGTVKFYSTPFNDVLIEAEIFGLPIQEGNHFNFHGMHIHESGDCSGSFENTGSHYNPENKQHPYHAGDLLPLFSNNGYAWYAYINGQLSIDEIIGKSIIIHEDTDDFTTQPSGNSGEKIGCGVIKSTYQQK